MDLSMGSPRIGNVPPAWAPRIAEIYVRGEATRRRRRRPMRTGPGAVPPRGPSPRASEREERSRADTRTGRRDVRGAFDVFSTGRGPGPRGSARGLRGEAAPRAPTAEDSTAEDARHRFFFYRARR